MDDLTEKYIQDRMKSKNYKFTQSVWRANRIATEIPHKKQIREIPNAEISEAGITKTLGLYIIAGEKEYRADLDALLTLLYKKVKLSDLENIPIKWGYPRLTYDHTLKILERK